MAAKDSTRGTLSANELSAFCAQLALITKAGIPAQEGISIMMEDAGDVRTRELMQSVLNKLEEGAPLHKALAANRPLSEIHAGYGGNRRAVRPAG